MRSVNAATCACKLRGKPGTARPTPDFIEEPEGHRPGAALRRRRLGFGGRQIHPQFRNGGNYCLSRKCLFARFTIATGQSDQTSNNAIQRMAEAARLQKQLIASPSDFRRPPMRMKLVAMVGVAVAIATVVAVVVLQSGSPGLRCCSPTFRDRGDIVAGLAATTERSYQYSAGAARSWCRRPR